MAWPTKTDFVDGDVLNASQMNNIGTNLNLYNPTSATSGQVPIADGAGSVAFGTPAAGSYTQITTGTVTSGTSVLISSVPSDYKNIEVWVYDMVLSASNYGILIAMWTNNGSDQATAGEFTYQVISGNGATISGEGNQGTSGGLARVQIINTPSNTFDRNMGVATFYNYSESTTGFKTAFGFGSQRTTSGYGGDVSMATGKQTTPAAFDQIQLLAESGQTFSSMSYIVWGIN